MAMDRLRDMSTQFLVLGFLVFCLVAFTIGFMYNNNPTGLGDEGDVVLEGIYSNLETQLVEAPEGSDALLNITSNTNPEASQLGSRDIVATSFNAKGSAGNYFEASKQLLSWVFTGTLGKMLLSVMGGLIGLTAYFLITKHIRLGD